MEPRWLCRQLGEAFAQLSRRVELRNGIKLLECACKRVRQAPHCSRRELRILRLEVMAMDFGQQASWSVELAIDKCRVADQLRLRIADLSLAPGLDLTLHRLKVPLDAVHSVRRAYRRG